MAMKTPTMSKMITGGLLILGVAAMKDGLPQPSGATGGEQIAGNTGEGDTPSFVNDLKNKISETTSELQEDLKNLVNIKKHVDATTGAIRDLLDKASSGGKDVLEQAQQLLTPSCLPKFTMPGPTYSTQQGDGSVQHTPETKGTEGTPVSPPVPTRAQKGWDVVREKLASRKSIFKKIPRNNRSEDIAGKVIEPQQASQQQRTAAPDAQIVGSPHELSEDTVSRQSTETTTDNLPDVVGRAMHGKDTFHEAGTIAHAAAAGPATNGSPEPTTGPRSVVEREDVITPKNETSPETLSSHQSPLQIPPGGRGSGNLSMSRDGTRDLGPGQSPGIADQGEGGADPALVNQP